MLPVEVTSLIVLGVSFPQVTHCWDCSLVPRVWQCLHVSSTPTERWQKSYGFRWNSWKSSLELVKRSLFWSMVAMVGTHLEDGFLMFKFWWKLLSTRSLYRPMARASSGAFNIPSPVNRSTENPQFSASLPLIWPLRKF